ncbi:leucine-rich repeat extensin-like protein 3 [Diachasma alloeum]|uniref:leucine-rich repeat extensin-like protein 3 n=1 Tax=Diachasma alloeum TaxID=454923 RepID=UPI0007382F62|nr:leucine-rich repeat extensin-like protein 3 [Diachasma alloeum]XP_015124594.1 leucine-rich repeat extensin-like protein 3 [Diachasma alloeum]
MTPPQLPPQSYIPPPDSAPIPYLSGKAIPAQQYQITSPNQSAYPSTLSSPGATTTPTQIPQFLMPQAPPGSNPYPPEFPTTASAIITTAPWSPTTPLPSTFTTPPQKIFYSHSHPPARSERQCN